ncbi:MAG: hypothetical protein WAW61_21645 [Methylococcaceae bacterium]
MTTNIEQNEKTKENHKIACRVAMTAIVDSIGADAPIEEVIDVIQIMAHMVLTNNGKYAAPIASHNGAFFCNELLNLIEESQKDVSPNSYAGGLM